MSRHVQNWVYFLLWHSNNIVHIKSVNCIYKKPLQAYMSYYWPINNILSPWLNIKSWNHWMVTWIPRHSEFLEVRIQIMTYIYIRYLFRSCFFTVYLGVTWCAETSLIKCEWINLLWFETFFANNSHTRFLFFLIFFVTKNVKQK